MGLPGRRFEIEVEYSVSDFFEIGLATEITFRAVDLKPKFSCNPLGSNILAVLAKSNLLLIGIRPILFGVAGTNESVDLSEFSVHLLSNETARVLLSNARESPAGN